MTHERRQFLIDEEQKKVDAVRKLQEAIQPNSPNQRIAIDLSFDAIMNEKEINSLSKQIKFSYGVLRQMETPFALSLFRCSPALRQGLDRFSAANWHVLWHDAPVSEVLEPSNVVYLSPDSPNVLEALDASKTYVIGGIVDKTRRKGETLKAAEIAGVQTARLPIQEHIKERLDHILNVNTVVEVLCRFHENGGNWERALKESLPQRKQASAGRRALRRRRAQDQATTTTTEEDAHDVETAATLSVKQSSAAEQQANEVDAQADELDAARD
ncbi:TPA: hypothetical protein N0F65_008153 [Lagenidium giganteum]|uniref:tRNA (guanine(9)-N(1))-methyltransferase n=1 Tax=Lagenidium giganteum TaxID=4803 RepID=A0AAV2YFB0_9STRA|nr:TPA: hypothetical protein N0F65_008153 [Lagenidium giganteum]